MMMCVWNDSDEAGNSSIKHGENGDTDYEDGHMESDIFCQLINNTAKHLFLLYVIRGYLGFRLIHFLLADVFECGRS